MFLHWYTSKIPVSLQILVNSLTKSTIYIQFVALAHQPVEGDDFHLVSQEVTFHQGATTGVTKNVSVKSLMIL